MLEWLASIGDFLSVIIDFIVSFFTNVVELVSLVFKGFAFCISVISALPPMYVVPFTALVCFSVIVAVVHFGG